MAAPGGVLQAWLLRGVAWREFPRCGRVVSHDSLRNRTPISPFPPRRAVHFSSALPAKNYLHKFSANSKKRPWYDSPWHPPTTKPTGLMALMKPPQKRGNNPRARALNAILFEALSGLLSTSEVADEVYDLHIELSKVAVSSDFSVCRAYWLSSGNKDTDGQIEQVLQKYAPQFRHLMISRHVLGNVPPVLFLRDKEDARLQEVEELFTLLKSEDGRTSLKEDRTSRRDSDLESRAEAPAFQPPSMFGIDHTELNQKILEYKKQMKDKPVEAGSFPLSQQQELQLAEIRKQNQKKKKVKKLKKSAYDNISPQEFLASNMDSESQEDLMEEEEDSGGRNLK